MEFCGVCDNMLYIKNENDKVFYKCNCCLKETTSFDTSSKCISKTKLHKESTSYKPFVNDNVFVDPTLPCIHNVTCPNAACSKNAEQENEVIYIKYDNTGMKYLYACKHCKHFWTLA
jgi:DNA-directed RNA polymerase subunit M/transcription elongation factor TFIIS